MKKDIIIPRYSFFSETIKSRTSLLYLALGIVLLLFTSLGVWSQSPREAKESEVLNLKGDAPFTNEDLSFNTMIYFSDRDILASGAPLSN